MRVFNPLQGNFKEYIKDISNDVESGKHDNLKKGIMIAFVFILILGAFTLGFLLKQWSCYAVAEKQCNIQCNDYICENFNACYDDFEYDNVSIVIVAKNISEGTLI